MYIGILIIGILVVNNCITFGCFYVFLHSPLTLRVSELEKLLPRVEALEKIGIDHASPLGNIDHEPKLNSTFLKAAEAYTTAHTELIKFQREFDYTCSSENFTS